MNEPQNLNEFVGNADALKRVRLFLDAAITRGEMPPHIAILGSRGRGKTLLAKILANELGSIFFIFNAAAIKTTWDMRNILAHSTYDKGNGVVIAIDEVHSLSRDATNCLLSAMESGIVTFKYKDKIVNEKIVQPTTIILMTTDEFRVFPPLISRCEKIYLRSYSVEESAKIAMGYAARNGYSLSNEAAIEIGKRSHGEGREIVHYIKDACSLASIKRVEHIDIGLIKELFDGILMVDSNGLQLRDIDTLKTLKEIGTSSIETLANILEEPLKNLRIRENILLKKGLIAINSYGRMLTDKGRRYIDNLSG